MLSRLAILIAADAGAVAGGDLASWSAHRSGFGNMIVAALPGPTVFVLAVLIGYPMVRFHGTILTVTE